RADPAPRLPVRDHVGILLHDPLRVGVDGLDDAETGRVPRHDYCELERCAAPQEPTGPGKEGHAVRDVLVSGIDDDVPGDRRTRPQKEVERLIHRPRARPFVERRGAVAESNPAEKLRPPRLTGDTIRPRGAGD